MHSDIAVHEYHDIRKPTIWISNQIFVNNVSAVPRQTSDCFGVRNGTIKNKSTFQSAPLIGLGMSQRGREGNQNTGKSPDSLRVEIHTSPVDRPEDSRMKRPL